MGPCPCLLFVDPKGEYVSNAERNLKGYALLFPKSDTVSNSILDRIFSKNCLEVVRDREVTPSQNTVNFEVIEISFCVYEDQGIEFRCRDSNIDTVRQLFSETGKTRFTTSNFFNPTTIGRMSIKDVNLIKQLITAHPNMIFRDVKQGSLLHFAAEKGHDGLFDMLLACGADVHQKKIDGSTVLHSAVSRNHPHNKSFVEALLKKGADISANNTLGATPLHIAAGAGDGMQPSIDLLLKYGSSLTATDAVGATPLFYSYAHPEMLRFLVEKGVEINVETTRGRTVLLEALGRKCFKSAEYILSQKPDTRLNGNVRAFHVALARRSEEHAQLAVEMLRQGFTVSWDDAKKPDIFFGAIDKGCLEIVQEALAKGVAVNQWHEYEKETLTPLHVACMKNREVIVRLLFERNADVNAKRKGVQTPLYFAVEFGSVEIVKLLFEATAGARSVHTLLFVAVQRAELDVLKYLLEQGLDPNFTDEKGRTCLSFISSHKCTLEVLDELVAFGTRFQYADIPPTKFLQWILDRCPIDASVSKLRWFFDRTNVVGDHLVKIVVLVPEIDVVKYMSERAHSPIQFNNVLKKDCELEAENLNAQIGDSNVTYRDILTSNIQRVACLTRNQDIVKEMDSTALQSRFPIYSSLLVCKFQMAVQWKNLADLAKPVMVAIFNKFTASQPLGQPVLANDISEMILKFLSNRDLFVLSRYCQPAKKAH